MPIFLSLFLSPTISTLHITYGGSLETPTIATSPFNPNWKYLELFKALECAQMRLTSLRLHGIYMPQEDDGSCETLDWSNIFPQSLTELLIGSDAMYHPVIGRHLCQVSGLRDLKVGYGIPQGGTPNLKMSQWHNLLNLTSYIEFLPDLTLHTPNVRRITTWMTSPSVAGLSGAITKLCSLRSLLESHCAHLESLTISLGYRFETSMVGSAMSSRIKIIQGLEGVWDKIKITDELVERLM